MALLGQSSGALMQAILPPSAWSGKSVGLGEIEALRVGLIAGLGAVTVLATVLLARMSRVSAASRAGKAFLAGCQAAALSPEETGILHCMANLAELKQPEAILSTAALFYRGANALMGSERISAMSDDGRMYISRMLLSIREKLGLNIDPDEGTIYSSRQVKEGSRLQIMAREWPGACQAHVKRNEPLEMTISSDSLMELHPRQMLTVRYIEGAKAWEFEAPVIRTSPEVAIGHCETVRCVNRRRFPRIPIQRDALLAAFPFVRPGGEPVPKFVPARLVEMGGPGMCLEAPLALEVGDRALVVVTMSPDNVMEAMGKVRRVAAKGDVRSISLELVSLNNDEVAQLSHATNVAELDGGEDAFSDSTQAQPALQGA